MCVIIGIAWSIGRDLFFFLIRVWFTYHVTLVSRVRHSDSTPVYAVLCSSQASLPSVTMQHYYGITDCIP